MGNRLMCSATNSTPHERMFNFARSSIIGCDIPDFLRGTNQNVLLKRHIRLKNDPLVDEVRLIETISPHFARIQYENGKVDTVSTRHLAPSVEIVEEESQPTSECSSEPTQSTDILDPCKQDNTSQTYATLLPHETRSGRKVKIPGRFLS